MVIIGQIPAKPASDETYTAYRKTPSEAATAARYAREAQLSKAGARMARRRVEREGFGIAVPFGSVVVGRC